MYYIIIIVIQDTIKVPNQTISLNMSNPEIILSPDEDIHTQQKISSIMQHVLCGILHK